MSRRVLVCGASAGIGRAIALAFAEQGDVVFGLARREDKLEELRALGITPIVADFDFREAAIQRVVEQLPFSIVIHNTGGPASGSLLNASCSDLEHGFARHVLSAHSLLRATLPFMSENGFGRFINILSTSVYEPIPNLGVSNTVRAAMGGWAKSISKELPRGVTMNNILPGFTDTERLKSLKFSSAQRKSISQEEVHKDWMSQVPEGRLAHPDEIAHAVLFLASSQASYIRGVSLAVDGGRLRSI